MIDGRMTEEEVLEKLSTFKDAIIRIKSEKEEAIKASTEAVEIERNHYSQLLETDLKLQDENRKLVDTIDDFKSKTLNTIKFLVENNLCEEGCELVNVNTMDSSAECSCINNSI